MSNNNVIILQGCIDQFKENNQLSLKDSELFELFALMQLTKNLDLSFDTVQNSITDGGNDGGIDSILILINDYPIESQEELDDLNFSRSTTCRIILTQCKKEKSFKESTIDKLIVSLPELFNLEKNETALLTRFNSNLVEKVMLARLAWIETSKRGGSLVVDINYCCMAPNIQINQSFKSKIQQLKQICTQNIFIGSKFHYASYSASELLTLYQKQRTKRLTLSFKEQPLSTNYGDFGIAYVGPVKLGDYVNFLKDDDGNIREELFESNIRHFQGEVDVNKRIRDTLKNENNKDFWWLNNGVTIIADNPNQVGKKLTIENVQIVNGLQTSYSIFMYHDSNEDDDRSVLIKVIINKDKETIDSIIASTNSQNPVSATLLRATEDMQRKIELYFLNQGYYYDRRKNYYKNQGKPASKIFSIQFTAQAIEAILFSNPHNARSKPTTLIKDNNSYNRIFSENEDFACYLNCNLIVKKTHEYFLGIEDIQKKSTISNFKLHLARVAASVVLNKVNINSSDLVSFPIEHFDKDKFNNALNLLINIISKYQENNQDENLINMAKAKKFTDFLMEKIEQYWDQKN